MEVKTASIIRLIYKYFLVSGSRSKEGIRGRGNNSTFFRVGLIYNIVLSLFSITSITSIAVDYGVIHVGNMTKVVKFVSWQSILIIIKWYVFCNRKSMAVFKKFAVGSCQDAYVIRGWLLSYMVCVGVVYSTVQVYVVVQAIYVTMNTFESIILNIIQMITAADLMLTSLLVVLLFNFQMHQVSQSLQKVANKDILGWNLQQSTFLRLSTQEISCDINKLKNHQKALTKYQSNVKLVSSNPISDGHEMEKYLVYPLWRREELKHFYVDKRLCEIGNVMRSLQDFFGVPILLLLIMLLIQLVAVPLDVSALKCSDCSIVFNLLYFIVDTLLMVGLFNSQRQYNATVSVSSSRAHMHCQTISVILIL